MNNFQEHIQDIQHFLQTPKRIVITSHANPDGDALGSALGLYHYLKQYGHTIMVVMPTELPDFLEWMPDFKHVVVAENHSTLVQQAIANAQIIFSLDYNSLSRVNEVGTWIGESPAYKIMIDHHLDPDDFATARLWRTSSSSTCELIYDFFEYLGVLDNVPHDAWNCVYVGLLTDTGGFRYATSPRLFRVVADMLERGVDNNLINDLVFNAYTIKRFRLLAYCAYQRLELLEDINTGIIALSKNDHDLWDIKRGDLEGVVNFILKIKQLKVAALITERKDAVKLSLRSKGSFSVQSICSQHFHGGGHLNASGGSSPDNLQKTVQRLKDILYANYKEELVS